MLINAAEVKSPTTIDIVDAQGRSVRSHLPLNANGRDSLWDYRNDQGRVVESGVYFAIIRGTSDEVVQRVVVVR